MTGQSSITKVSAVLSLSIVLWLGLISPVSAKGLILDGVEIADEATFASAKQEGEIVIYGTYPSEALTPILEGFKKDTGIKFDYLRLPSRRLYDRVISEFAAGKLPADYIDLTDLPLLTEFVQKGILSSPHKVPSFDRIPIELKDPQGRWYVLIRPVMIVGINTALVKEADYPVSWKDLLSEKWKRKIGMPSIDAGGSAFTAFSFLRLKVDSQFWKKLSGQNPRIYPSQSPAVTDLVRGETSVAILAAEFCISQIEKKAPVKAIFPSEGFSSFPAAGGIASTAKHPNAARVYLNWMTSKRGGELIKKTGAYALHPEAGPPEAAGLVFPPESKVWNIKAEDWEQWRDPYTKEWRETFKQQ